MDGEYLLKMGDCHTIDTTRGEGTKVMAHILIDRVKPRLLESTIPMSIDNMLDLTEEEYHSPAKLIKHENTIILRWYTKGAESKQGAIAIDIDKATLVDDSGSCSE